MRVHFGAVNVVCARCLRPNHVFVVGTHHKTKHTHTIFFFMADLTPPQARQHPHGPGDLLLGNMRTFTASSLQKMGGSSKDFRSAALGSLCSIPRTAVCESEWTQRAGQGQRRHEKQQNQTIDSPRAT